MGIRIRTLRLKGSAKDYEVNLVRDGHVLPLAVIAGEISTGKTSVLEFIAYCLGARTHPQHQEVQRQVLGALLEVELSGEITVIERAAFSDQNVVYIHQCSLDRIDAPHAKVRKVIEPAGADDSLSMLLLEHCGLAGIDLKEAPTQPDSPSQPLSFRDLLWLSFLENPRLDSRQLLFEANHMKQLKLRQVIEVIFGVHDDQLAKLSDQLKRLEEQRLKRLGALDSLRAFLDESNVPDLMELEHRRNELAADTRDLMGTLDRLEGSMRADTAFADVLRHTYAESRAEAGRLANAIRYNDTLLRRLLPLRGQYAEDERKLVFFSEAKALFDPLHIEVCPSCLQRLPKQASIVEGSCSLCGQTVPAGDEPIDVKAELAAVRARRREIERYVDEVEDELSRVRAQSVEASAAEAEVQSALDSAVAQRLSPYVAERERLVRDLERVHAAEAQLETELSWRESLERRQLEILRLEEQLAKLRAEIEDRRAGQRSREELLAELTERFRRILADFGFPKLNDPSPPSLDRNFVPSVRGVSYRDIGSAGAMTLIALAWQLAIFELAVEQGYPHPGFLMIDSPQKNLTPEGAARPDEFGDPAIGSHVWDHLVAFASGTGRDAQLIVVDNKPRPQAAGVIVVEYTGVPGQPPYGLIDNEEL